ncbi:SDR family oxidoreductase [Micromonospora sp. CA-246542]|uniref:SDR family oxidoreductase n=1 Tax=Micromonospora sp. CA-246542 TaxID=3239959 RepID=UPI003D906469
MRLRDKVAVITGAARGVGRACALAYAKEGADVVLMDIGAGIAEVPYPLGTVSQLAHTAATCRTFGVGVAELTADLRDPASLERLRDLALQRFGAVDVVINNAGLAAPSGRPVHQITEDEWDVMLDVDLTGAWRMTKVFAPLMVEARSGSIINVASTAGLVGYRHFAGYVAAKHGLVGLTKAAALDYAPMGVRVNAICPGNIRDDADVEGRMLAEVARSLGVPADEHETLFLRDQPMNALVEPQDVAATAVWLGSDETRRVTGTTVTVDAGFSSR